ncbi:MAG: site-specific DNA-methyltransferase [Candidatus Marsarchaeota archaeon]|nr:site-specific DNA-methyltransferase [Candidatus Marsarchaeota archaeon]
MASEHLVVFGDCRGMKELGDGSVHLIITSPPYFNARILSSDTESHINDLASYLRGIQKVFSECYRVLGNGRFICINLRDIYGFEELPIHIMFALKRSGFDYHEDILWNSNGTSEQFERTLVFRKGRLSRKQRIMFNGMRKESKCAVASCRSGPARYKKDRNFHPDVLTEELIESLISRFSCEGETVLDPFLGNGILSKVASCMSRRSVGYEDNPYSLPVIRQKTGITDDHLKVVFQ